MNKVLCAFFVLGVTMALVLSAYAGSNGKMDLKVGDEVYACNCGEKCPCNTLSRNPGKCTCGKELVKAKVTKVEEGKAYLMAKGWEKERVFKTTGKYACNCPGCKCGTISQNPGKCSCGVEMKKVTH